MSKQELYQDVYQHTGMSMEEFDGLMVNFMHASLSTPDNVRVRGIVHYGKQWSWTGWDSGDLGFWVYIDQKWVYTSLSPNQFYPDMLKIVREWIELDN